MYSLDQAIYSFLQRIMSDALVEHVENRLVKYHRSSVSEDINALDEEEQKQEALVESLNKTRTKYKMEISA